MNYFSLLAPDFNKILNQPLSKTIRNCKIKMATSLSLGSLLRRCLKLHHLNDLYKILSTPDADKPLIETLVISDLKKLLGLGPQYLSFSPSAMKDSLVHLKLSHLFLPLADFFAFSGKSLEQGTRMPIAKLLNQNFPTQAHLFGFFQRSSIHGAGLGFLRQRSVDEVLMAAGITKDKFANMTVYDVMKRASMLFKEGM